MNKKAHIYRITTEIKIPRVPNFFILTNDSKIPVSAINEEGLKMIGELWTQNLIERAKAQGDD